MTPTQQREAERELARLDREQVITRARCDGYDAAYAWADAMGEDAVYERAVRMAIAADRTLDDIAHERCELEERLSNAERRDMDADYYGASAGSLRRAS